MRTVRFCVETLIAAAAVAVAIFVFINLLVDPYNEYQVVNDYAYRSRSPAAHQLINKLEEGKYQLMFGTSSSANFDEKSMGAPLLNFSMSLYGDPERVFHRLNDLSPKHIANIEKMYFALERDSLHCNSVQHNDVDFGSRLGLLYLTVENIGRKKIINVADRIVKDAFGVGDAIVNQYGTYVHLKPRAYRHIEYPGGVKFEHESCQVEYLAKIDAFAKEHDIPMVFFRTVLQQDMLKAADFSTIKAHYKLIVENVDNFYSLLWLDGISNDRRAFRDPVHPSYEVTTAQGELIRTNPPTYRVTVENLTSYIDRLHEQVMETAPAT